ncbi:MAG TPA: hypothetical protein ENJ45_03890 [Phaeodactylibacter sp.]|nr:hypothetical protein [Phaeodactylibacter sp.]
MKKFFVFLMIALAMLLTFSSCEKDDSPQDTATEQIAMENTGKDFTTAQELMKSTDDEVEEQVALAMMPSTPNSPPCPTRSLEFPQGTFPNTLTIDFGMEGCEGPHGHIRKGKIIVYMSAPMYEEGASRTLTFEDFSVDEVQIEGTKTLVNLGYNDEGFLSFSRTVEGALISFPDETNISYDSEHTLVQIAGADTPANLHDNIFAITGSTSGINRMDMAFTATVVDPLIKKRTCRWIVAGTSEIESDNGTATLNYGNGNCNRIAQLTLPNGNTLVVHVRRWW